MINTQTLPKAYTPKQVAIMLQLSKNTIYQLINRGEIVAKKIGKVYRIPVSSLSFIFVARVIAFEYFSFASFCNPFNSKTFPIFK